MPYSFSVSLLSAQKTGNPSLIGTTLSAFGVNTISLSTLDKGIAFNPISPLLSSTVSMSIEGSTFVVDKVYHNSIMALVKVPVNNLVTYTVFTQNSAYSIVPLSAISSGRSDVQDANGRRLWTLGYA
jgi:hypothetical protein